MPNVKRGPLNEVEMFYIESHFLAMPIEDMAIKLNRSVVTVNKYIDKLNAKIEKEKRQTKVKISEARMDANDQFAKKRGSVVMTQNASMIGDALRVKPPTPPYVMKIRETGESNG